MWNIFKKNKSKRDEQRNLLISSLTPKSFVDYSYNVVNPKKPKSAKKKDINTALPKGWSPSEYTPYWDQESSNHDKDQYYWWKDVSKNYNFPQTTLNVGLKRMEWPKKYPILPGWVEQYYGFSPTAWILGVKTTTKTTVNLVTYEAGTTTSEPSFAKIVFTVNDVPFKQMKNLCASVSKYNNEELQLHGLAVAKAYDMDCDGRIRDKTKQFLPDAFAVDCAVDDLYMQYEDWRIFPDVEDHNTMVKLSFAWKNVVAMQKEERSGKIKGEIHDIRDDIKRCQERITRLEKEQNELYERAADSLNLLEEYGFDFQKIEEIQNREFMGSETTNIDMAFPINKLASGMGLSLNSFDQYNSASEQYALAP